jgi:protein required for attachment to host cells
MIWIVNLNSNLCTIYHYKKATAQVSLIKKIQHPELREKSGDSLTSDKPGHFQARDMAHGTYAPRTDPKQAAVDSFAREVANELNHGRNTNQYEHLILIAPAHMSGVLLQHTDKHVKEMIRNHIHKDILFKSDAEVLDFVKTHAQYADG